MRHPFDQGTMSLDPTLQDMFPTLSPLGNAFPQGTVGTGGTEWTPSPDAGMG